MLRNSFQAFMIFLLGYGPLASPSPIIGLVVPPFVDADWNKDTEGSDAKWRPDQPCEGFKRHVYSPVPKMS